MKQQNKFNSQQEQELSAQHQSTQNTVQEFSTVDVDAAEPRFADPLQASVQILLKHGVDEVVLLGSIATDKYLEVLRQELGERLRFPLEFVGRGDMSRGGLLLRCVEEGRELTYAAVPERRLRGTRPPKLPPRA